MPSIIQKIIKIQKENPGLIDEQDLRDIVKGQSVNVYRRMEKQFKKESFDVNALNKRMDDADKYYELAKNTMGIQAKKRFNNYRETLSNIFFSKSMYPKFTDTDGILKNTYVGLNKTKQEEIQKKYAQQMKQKIQKGSKKPKKDIPGFESLEEEESSTDTSEVGGKKPPPPPPPSLLDQDTPAVKAFKKYLENESGGLSIFKDVLQKGSTKKASIIKLIQVLRKNYPYKRIAYSKRTKANLIDKVTDVAKKIAVDYKLDKVLEEIEQPVKAQKIKEEIEELEVAEQIAKKEDIPIQDVLDLTKEQEMVLNKKVEAQLAGEAFDIDKYIKDKFQISNNERITNFLVRYDDRDQTVYYKKSTIKPQNYSKKSIRDTLDKILLNNVYIDRIGYSINRKKDEENFKGRTKQTKAELINNSIKHKITPEDIKLTLQDPELRGFFNNIQQIVHGEQKPLTIENYYNTVEEIRKLKMSTDKQRLAQIAGQIVKYIPRYEDKENELIKFIDDRINIPADVPILPKGIKIKPVGEEALTDLDKYNNILKDITEKEKKPENERTPEETADIQRLKTELKKYVGGAKKEKAKQALKDKKASVASRRKGAFRPHFKNPTEKAIDNVLEETAEQQIKDIQNWFIFDIPEYYTGVGNKLENPLVKQNEQRAWAMVSGTTKFTNTVPYLLTDGVDERKDFGNQHSQLNQQGINIGLQNNKWEENEQQFLERFNSGSNGLFTQDISKKEVSDFQNIYQTPARFIDGEGKPPQWTNNRGITHNDKEWIDNLNLFYKGAVIQ